MDDDNLGITSDAEPFWIHTAGGLHMGRMEPRPLAGEFDSILTLAADPGHLDPAIRHKHLPLSYMRLDPDVLAQAIEWTHEQFMADRKLLVRSEGGRQRPGLVIAGLFVRLGATETEAIYSVRRNCYEALDDFRYRAVIRALYNVLNRPL